MSIDLLKSEMDVGLHLLTSHPEEEVNKGGEGQACDPV